VAGCDGRTNAGLDIQGVADDWRVADAAGEFETQAAGRAGAGEDAARIESKRADRVVVGFFDVCGRGPRP
jgi:hypothetical protein